MDCPDCKKKLKEKEGIEGLTIICPDCNEEFVKCLTGLVPIDKFRKLKQDYNGN